MTCSDHDDILQRRITECLRIKKGDKWEHALSATGSIGPDRGTQKNVPRHDWYYKVLTHIPETTVDDEDSFATSDQSDNISVQSPDTTRHGTSPRQKKDKIRRQHLNLASITKNQNPTYNQDPSAKNKQNRTPDNGTLLWLPPPDAWQVQLGEPLSPWHRSNYNTWYNPYKPSHTTNTSTIILTSWYTPTIKLPDPEDCRELHSALTYKVRTAGVTTSETRRISAFFPKREGTEL